MESSFTKRKPKTEVQHKEGTHQFIIQIRRHGDSWRQVQSSQHKAKSTKFMFGARRQNIQPTKHKHNFGANKTERQTPMKAVPL